jgi:hypothetical protein
MPAPLPEAFVSLLRTDETAALAALAVIAETHREIFDWAAWTFAVPEPRRRAVDRRPRKANGGQAIEQWRPLLGSPSGPTGRRRREIGRGDEGEPGGTDRRLGGADRQKPDERDFRFASPARGRCGRER